MSMSQQDIERVAVRIVSVLQEYSWGDAHKIVEMSLAYMYAGIDGNAEKSRRLAILFNGVMLMSHKMREAIEETGGMPPETLQ